jgi:hypothetical protein
VCLFLSLGKTATTGDKQRIFWTDKDLGTLLFEDVAGQSLPFVVVRNETFGCKYGYDSHSARKRKAVLNKVVNVPLYGILA